MRFVTPTLAILLVAGSTGAFGCSAIVGWTPYVDIVQLEGGRVAGLHWVRTFNILDYKGSQTVKVSGSLHGKRVPLAKWEHGLECSYDASGAESCVPNGDYQGVNLEHYLGWAPDAERFSMPLFVETDGRERRLWLRGKRVRNTPELQGERIDRAMNEMCRDS